MSIGTKLLFGIDKSLLLVMNFSLWDDFPEGLKIESGRTPLIIRFLGTKTKINILGKNLEGVPLSKLSEKGKPG